MTIVSVYQLDQLEIGSPVLVALVDLPDAKDSLLLEQAYYLTQNLQGSWSKGPEILWDGEVHPNGDYNEAVSVIAPLPVHNGKTYGLRSSSIGDIFKIGEASYKVASFGFELIEQAA